MAPELTLRVVATIDVASSAGNDLSSRRVESLASKEHGKGEIGDILEKHHVDVALIND